MCFTPPENAFGNQLFLDSRFLIDLSTFSLVQRSDTVLVKNREREALDEAQANLVNLAFKSVRRKHDVLLNGDHFG